MGRLDLEHVAVQHSNREGSVHLCNLSSTIQDTASNGTIQAVAVNTDDVSIGDGPGIESVFETGDFL